MGNVVNKKKFLSKKNKKKFKKRLKNVFFSFKIMYIKRVILIHKKLKGVSNEKNYKNKNF